MQQNDINNIIIE